MQLENPSRSHSWGETWHVGYAHACSPESVRETDQWSFVRYPQIQVQEECETSSSSGLESVRNTTGVWYRRQQKAKIRPSSRCCLIFDGKPSVGWNGAGGVCVFRIGSWFPLLGGTQVLVMAVSAKRQSKSTFLSRKQPKLRRCHPYGGGIRTRDRHTRLEVSLTSAWTLFRPRGDRS